MENYFTSYEFLKDCKTETLLANLKTNLELIDMTPNGMLQDPCFNDYWDYVRRARKILRARGIHHKLV